MHKERASEVGFCVFDSDADRIAERLVDRVHGHTFDLEAEVNRLYRGRNAYDLSARSQHELETTIQRLKYLAETLRTIQRAQGGTSYLQAAE